MVDFASGTARRGVNVYQTPNGQKWVKFEDYWNLRAAASLTETDAQVLEWAITTMSATADALEGRWDSEKSRQDCENVRRAVEVMDGILERLR